MEDIISNIDRIISACSKRDLIPSVEVVDELLDLRSRIKERDTVATPTPL
jgi:hypothetical protein